MAPTRGPKNAPPPAWDNQEILHALGKVPYHDILRQENGGLLVEIADEATGSDRAVLILGEVHRSPMFSAPHIAYPLCDVSSSSCVPELSSNTAMIGHARVGARRGERETSTRKALGHVKNNDTK